MLRRPWLALLLVFLPALVWADDEKLGPTSGERLLEQAVSITHRNWWDEDTVNKIDWKGLVARYREQAAAAATPLEAHRVVNHLLGELKTSHLALMEGSVYDRELAPEFQSRRTLRACLELELLDQSYYLSCVLEGSPADKAGLRVGDEVLAIDGVKTEESPLLQEAGHDPGLTLPPGFVLDVKSKDELHLRVRHERGQSPVDIAFAPTETRMLDATKSSVHVAVVDGKRLGVIHLWHFMSSDMNEVLKKALAGPFADCDGLVLDVRGRGGRADVIYQVTNNFTGKHATWKKPIVVLQDHGTRSAKEIFVWAWKKKHLGKLVGERTLGAVIGCSFKKLFDGSVLMFPLQDVRPMTKGESLEGHGIEPDVAVDQGDLRYRDGRDLILEKGERVLLEEIASWHPASRWL